MKSILKINDDILIIGDATDNSIIEVRKSDCNFEPLIGQKVNVFKNEKTVYVTKVEEIAPTIDSNSSLQDKIHINIVNDNSRNNDFPSHSILHMHVVNKVVYLILALFVGGLGIHKFYAGRIGMGILYLIFSWTTIPLIVSLIEFIIACFKTPDANGRIVV